jgi:hypothetical protein
MTSLTAALAPIVDPSVSAIVAAVALATLSWSFAVDVARLWRQREPKDIVGEGRA